MKTTLLPWPIVIATLAASCLALPACEPAVHTEGKLPPAYTSNQITDPAIVRAAGEITTWAAEQKGAEGKALYGKVEVLAPVPIVQPYGVGIFQEELRLPVIFTTGPGWAGLEHEKKEAAVATAFNHLSDVLRALDHKPELPPTLTVQSPQGIELAWINRLDPSGKNVHGDD